MPAKYKYRGIKGRKYVNGELEAIDRDEAAFLIKEQGVIIADLTLTAGQERVEELIDESKKEKSDSRLYKKKVPFDQLIIFTKQLETMIRSGLPIIKTLDMLIDQTKDPVLRKIIMIIRGKVEGGAQLSDAFTNYPLVFNNIYVNLLRAGEASGRIDLFLKKLVVSMQKTEKIRRSIRSALIYPSVLFVVAVAVIALMMVYVVPVFQDMFKGSPGGLPAITQVVVDISEFIRDPMRGGLFAVLLIISAVSFPYAIKRSFKLRRFFHYKFLKVKLFGELIRKSSLAKIAMVLGQLTSAGVPIMEALDIAQTSIGNIAVQEALDDVKKGVYSGEPMSELFRAQPDIFDATFSGMVAVGENTGNMEEMFESITSYYEDQMDDTIQQLTALLEPVMIVFMGVTIGFILVAMYTPMFQMGQVL
jgi:type IV pilus assembly protein PilC